MLDLRPTPDAYTGLDQARRTLRAHNARARIWHRMQETCFLMNPMITAVHVDNATRADRVTLTAFDIAGHQVAADLLYVDHEDQRMDLTPEFDHNFNQMEYPSGSEIEVLAQRDHGWIIAMSALRDYDLTEDRQATQRRMFLSHLADMVKTDEARAFLLPDDLSGEAGQINDEAA